ncbi:RluA family pseudouridine synthase [bacterium]|nr:RluA family pseudouridine synthase [bacterium]
MKYLIEENDEHKRLDKFVSELFDDISRQTVQNAVKDGLIKVNCDKKKSSYSLKEHDIVEFSDDIFEIKPLAAENIPLDIEYEDENMLVVNKPSGMLTHPAGKEKTGTLVNALLNYCPETLSDIGGEFRRGIVHRLDRNTSGLLMAAKNNKTHEFLQEQIKTKSAIRKYYAVVKGVIDLDEGIINKPIARSPKNPQRMDIVDGGRESLTLFKVLERFKEYTFIELELKTGRTHQIRVHMSSIGHPVMNDTLYGAGMSKIHTQEQVLMAYSLTFTKPFSDEIINVEIDYDEKLKRVLKYLRSKN